MSGDCHKPKQNDLERSHQIVSAFADLMAENPPLIGDCDFLPYPKADIQNAIGRLITFCESKRDLACDLESQKKHQENISFFQNLRNGLVYFWHDIDPKDKDSVAKLNRLTSFPDWALPLKRKYLDHEKASQEACDAEIQTMVSRVERENSLGNLAN